MAPKPFSNRLTVLAAMPACFPKSRTPQPKAALAIRTCDGVITSISDTGRRLTATPDWSTLYSSIGIIYQGATMNMPALKAEVQIYNCLRQKVMDQYRDLDDETIRDTLEGITDLHEMIAAVIRSALVDEALQAGLRAPSR